MPLWSKTGTKPQYLNSANTRNCIATNDGWVLRSNYTDVHSNARQKDEILVAIGNLGDSTDMGQPSISEIYLTDATGTEASSFTNGELVLAKVVFDEPINLIGNSTFTYTLAVANTVSGNAVTATANGSATATNANNTLEFRFAPVTGTYKINAQNLSNTVTGNSTTLRMYSLNTSGEIANLTISAAVSNALGTFTVTA